jgi:CBS domain containing-hemolysin-like protein
MITELLLLIILILLSAFFSSTEIAFVNSNKIKIEVKARDNNLSAKSILYFVNNPDKFFSTILIGNNIVNIAFASISTILLFELYKFNNWQILTITTLVILIFGDIFPKYFAREFSEVYILFFAIPIRAVYFVFSPLVRTTSFIVNKLTSNKSISNEKLKNIFTVEEIENLVEESREAGIVNKDESEIIKRVFDMREQKVNEALRPRTEMVGVEISSSIEDVINIFIESGYSKLPVYEENLDNIKGVVFAYDLFNSPKDLKSILREISFVPETKKSIDVLNDFLEKRISIAIVVDEFGGTAGLVTTEDVIEELFGEIRDEHDVEEMLCRKMGEDTYIISGKVEIDFINEQFNLEIPYGDYETIAGFITSKTGRIPVQDEKIKIGNFNFQVIKANPIRIELVKMVITKN